MREDLDPGVAGRFRLLDDISVPDTWSRVQLLLLDPAPLAVPLDAATPPVLLYEPDAAYLRVFGAHPRVPLQSWTDLPG